MTVKDPDCDFVTSAWGGEPPKLIISSQWVTQIFFHACMHAQTLEAYSRKFRCTVWFALPCKQWSCRICSEQKIKDLAYKTEQAKPNRLLTLTVDPQRWETPRKAFDGTRRQVPELIRALRKRFGEIEYLRVTELTKAGWPHFHALLRSVYLPQPVVKALWEKLTGAQIVDLRQVDQSFNSYMYLVKYLTKMHKLGWTNRHVSTSRGFFPPQREHKQSDIDLEEPTIIETHPGNLMYHQYRGAELVEISYGVFTLNPREDLVSDQNAHADWCTDPPEEKPCSAKVETPKSDAKSDRTRTLFDLGSPARKGKSKF